MHYTAASVCFLALFESGIRIIIGSISVSCRFFTGLLSGYNLLIVYKFLFLTIPIFTALYLKLFLKCFSFLLYGQRRKKNFFAVRESGDL